MCKKFLVVFWFWTGRNSELIIVSKRGLMSKTHLLCTKNPCERFPKITKARILENLSIAVP